VLEKWEVRDIAANSRNGGKQPVHQKGETHAVAVFGPPADEIQFQVLFSDVNGNQLPTSAVGWVMTPCGESTVSFETVELPVFYDSVYNVDSWGTLQSGQMTHC
jgi:hypothetical protein